MTEPSADNRHPLRTHVNARRPARPGRAQAFVALGSATLALAAAVVAAVGPANAEFAEFRWPPATLPPERPGDGWYAPLPLLNRVPSALEIQLPCALAPALHPDRPTTVLATARRPRATDALEITLVDGALRIRVGRSVYATTTWPRGCPLRLALVGGKLRLPARTLELTTDTLESMPVVTGLFTGLDLRRGQPPRVLLRSRAFATSQSTRQTAAAILAAMLACGALVALAARPRNDGSPFRLRRHLGAAWRARDGTDLFVLGVLVVWWIVAPTFSDDGWIATQQRAFSDLGANDFYYDVWGINVPLGHWLHWLRHWVGSASSDLVVVRLPTLFALLASWPVCRWCLGRVVVGRPPSSARWTLAAAFALGALAWGMTLRAEPFISLLMVSTLAAMVSFVFSPRLGPLAIALPLAAVAATAHPVGLLATAPLLAAAPELIRWLRAAGPSVRPAVVALVLATLAVGLVFFTVDADLSTRLADARVAREADHHNEPWWREYIRYTRLDERGGGSAARRLSIALLGVAAVAWLTRGRARRHLPAVPGRCLLAGFALLAFVPSKWPWHVGGLVAVGAVAAAAEIGHVVAQPARHRRETTRRLLLVLAVLAAALWSWESSRTWSPFDLQELSWTYSFDIAAWVLVAGVLAAWLAERRRPERRLAPAGQLASLVGWSIPCAALVVTCVTITVLAIDALVTPWSPARQNLEALVGGDSCGLANALPRGSELVDEIADPQTATLLVPSIGMFFPCATTPSISGGIVEIPRFVVFESTPWPLLEPDGPFAAVDDLYVVRTIAAARGLRVLAVSRGVRGFGRADAVRVVTP